MPNPPAEQSRLQLTPALILAFAGVYLIWGSTYLGIKLAVQTLPPFLLGGVRFVIAGAILYAIARPRASAAPTRREWASGLLLGTLLILGGNGLVNWASQSKVPSGLVALICAGTPIWVALFDWLIFRAKRPTRQVAIGLAVGFAGVVLLIGPQRLSDAASTSDLPPLALLAIVAATLSWSIGTLLGKRVPQTSSMLLATALQMLCGGAVMIVVGTALGEWARVDPSTWTPTSISAFAYLTLVGSLLGFTSYVYLVRHTTPTAVMTYAYVNPAVAVLLGWLVLDERLDRYAFLGAILVLAGIALITAQRKPRTEPVEIV